MLISTDCVFPSCGNPTQIGLLHWVASMRRPQGLASPNVQTADPASAAGTAPLLECRRSRQSSWLPDRDHRGPRRQWMATVHRLVRRRQVDSRSRCRETRGKRKQRGLENRRRERARLRLPVEWGDHQSWRVADAAGRSRRREKAPLRRPRRRQELPRQGVCREPGPDARHRRLQGNRRVATPGDSLGRLPQPGSAGHNGILHRRTGRTGTVLASATKRLASSASGPSPHHPRTPSDIPLPRQIRQTPSATNPPFSRAARFAPSQAAPGLRRNCRWRGKSDRLLEIDNVALD